MSIFPLPMFEADADPSRRDGLTDAEAYARLKPPTSIVVRFGSMRHVAEYGYSGDAKPGCGSKLVARTHRGTEVVEMLTTTCGNSGCGKSVSRQEMLEYIENSGGRDYPFHTDGQILRVASIDDLNRWSEVKARVAERVGDVKRIVAESGLPMKVVEVEPIFGQELLTVYFMSEERVDFRDLVRRLSSEFHSRIELRQVGARDEARLVADYERCGQHCCCKNFLKVLKPISMRSAKIQKATLDPLKISGRCGRLMCCLRYEDETYEDLKKRLPKNKTRVGTAEGPGLVVDSKILVQLVLVRLEADGREIAVPVEELLDPETCPKPVGPSPLGAAQGGAAPSSRPQSPRGTTTGDPLRGLSPAEAARRASDRGREQRGERARSEQQDAFRSESLSRESERPPVDGEPEGAIEPGAEPSEGESGSAKRRRRRRRRRRGEEGVSPGEGSGGTRERDPSAAPLSDAADQSGDDGDAGEEGPDGDDGPEGPATDAVSGDSGPGERGGEPRRRRRRRRRRRGGGEGSAPPAPAG